MSIIKMWLLKNDKIVVVVTGIAFKIMHLKKKMQSLPLVWNEILFVILSKIIYLSS